RTVSTTIFDSWKIASYGNELLKAHARTQFWWRCDGISVPLNAASAGQHGNHLWCSERCSGVIERFTGFFSVPRFSIGDRVQVVGDIARLYACNVGVIVEEASNTASVLNQYVVRLADG